METENILKKLIQKWLKYAKKGKVLGIVPILGVLTHILKEDKIDSPPCQSGNRSITISTDGKILACPIAVENKWAKLGEIKRDTWKTIRRIKIEEPCTKCKYYRYCGGRCLYAYKERLWGENGFKKICRLTQEFIEQLSHIKEEVSKLIQDEIIIAEEIYYPKYNNTTEIIP